MTAIHGRGVSAATLLCRTLPLVLLWWVLSGGDAGSWLIGVPVILGATVLGLALRPSGGWRWTLTGAVRFVPFFLRQSLGGGVDVALRALRPGRPLHPAFVDYELRLAENPARVFMANVISLLPGTLSAQLEGRRLRVHTLTRGQEVPDDLQDLESRVAALFGLELTAPEEAGEAKGG